MAAPTNAAAISLETPITIKIQIHNQLKKLKLPLRDLGASVLPDKLRHVLDVKPHQVLTLERYSDSAAGYIVLDAANNQAFKTLIRAAKAKLKLRLRATITPNDLHTAPALTVLNEKAVAAAMPLNNCSRDSTAFDRRSVGSGIFQFREARASQQTLVNDEAPLPQPFHAEPATKSEVLPTPLQPTLAFRPRESIASAGHAHAWSVYCNECDKAMENEHFHCSVCDGGDYDLCQPCVSSGKLCPGEGHWLIKRTIQNGQVVNSTTERVSPRKAKSIPALLTSDPVEEKEMPGSFTDESKTLNEELRTPTRTCNCCVIVLPEREFVTCTDCADFDLCIGCHTADKHGHHPGHGFKPATEGTMLPMEAETKLAPGRNTRHNAICDGCDKMIYGVRHKCLNCPDWDYCNDCVKDAHHTHPRHRFAALYTPIPDQGPPMARHFGIYCDGPLCNKKSVQSYIQGIRYKCTICHDTDFCASCEALPGNHHNRTHPLIKLKTPVRNVNVSTENEDLRGNVRVMGDRRSSPAPAAGASASPASHANAATQVQTVADIAPTEVKKDTQPIPIPVKKLVEKSPAPVVPATLLNAHFVRDSIPDGMTLEPEARFTQVWTLKNPGPHAWPAGCSVRYVGGDNMLNVDNSHPASVTAIADATESNVVGREVQVGEEVAFKVVMKAPIREGKSISYWRLKAADGTPFGHRLWCDIEIKKQVQAPTPAQTPEALMQAQRQLQMLQLQNMQALRAKSRHVDQQNAREQQRPATLPPSYPYAFTPQRPSQQAGPSHEQPPAYDSMHLSARLAAMREQQKHRREQQRREQTATGLKAHKDRMVSAQKTLTDYLISQATDKASPERRETIDQKMAAVKASVLKNREDAEQLVKQQTAAETKNTEDSERVRKIVQAVVAGQEEQESEEEKLKDSQMVFPKLDKESPASSTYQSATSSSSKGKAAYVENEEGEVERSATPNAAPVPVATSPVDEEDDFVELDDELEVLSANGDESSDDGFLTDEEYDILDASDHETVASNC